MNLVPLISWEDTIISWEDEPNRTRTVRGPCRTCERIMLRDYDKPLDPADPYIVSPSGIAHSGGEYGITDCGRDATGPDWWWRT